MILMYKIKSHMPTYMHTYVPRVCKMRRPFRRFRPKNDDVRYNFIPVSPKINTLNNLYSSQHHYVFIDQLQI